MQDTAAPAPHSPGRTESPRGLIDLATAAVSPSERTILAAFLSADSFEKTLALYATGRSFDSVEHLGDQLACDIAALDRRINEQVNQVIHHPAFQKLEARWRGLRTVVENSEPPHGDSASGTVVKILDVKWRELTSDFDAAVEFDQSHLFRKVYSEHYDMLGGEPFGLLIGDYEVFLKPPRAAHSLDTRPAEHRDDIETLRQLSHVAAAAFCPFITQADPSLLGLNRFADLERAPDLSALTSGPEFIRFKALRQEDDARFLGLTVPRVLARKPWTHDGACASRYQFVEEIDGIEDWCWASSIWGFACVVIRAYEESGWFGDIRGTRRGKLTAGVIDTFASPSFSTDAPGVAPMPSTDVVITDEQERELAELGFIGICPCQYTAFAAIYSAPSLHVPKTYDSAEASANAKVAASLPNVLCASRFAHYLKQQGRQKIGSMIGAAEMEDFLQRWLVQFVEENASAPVEQRAKRPLAESKVVVRERPGSPGVLDCSMWFKPHYQFEQMSVQLELETRLASNSG